MVKNSLLKASLMLSGNYSFLVGNNSTSDTLEYKDVVNLYLNSWLTTGLVLVGSAEVYNILYGNRKNEKDTSSTKESISQDKKS